MESEIFRPERSEQLGQWLNLDFRDSPPLCFRRMKHWGNLTGEGIPPSSPTFFRPAWMKCKMDNMGIGISMTSATTKKWWFPLFLGINFEDLQRISQQVGWLLLGSYIEHIQWLPIHSIFRLSVLQPWTPLPNSQLLRLNPMRTKTRSPF